MANDEGYQLTNNSFAVGGAWIKQSKETFVPIYTINLEEGKKYRFLQPASDSRRREVDLEVLDKDGKVVARDIKTDPEAVVDYEPAESGTIFGAPSPLRLQEQRPLFLSGGNPDEDEGVTMFNPKVTLTHMACIWLQSPGRNTMPIHDWTRVYAGLFHDFHQTWSVFLKDALNTGILPRGCHLHLVEKAGTKEPDALEVRKSSKEFYSDLANRIVVQHRLGRTIAVIEIVSPGNKDSKRAFKQFIDKSLEFIRSGVHLLVIDLYGPTKRDPFGVHRVIWDEFEDEDILFEFPAGKDRILASYDAGREKAAYVEPIALGDVLPDMPLFLFEGRHIKVPLDATYRTTWGVLPRALQVIVETGVMPVS